MISKAVLTLGSVIACVFVLSKMYNVSTSDQEMISVSLIKTLAFTKYFKIQSRIQHHCEKDLKFFKVNEYSKWKKDLFFDYEHSLIFCGISKVSSTTWTTNLLKLKSYGLRRYRKTLDNEGFRQEEIRPEIKRRMFQLEDDSIEEANKKLVSFAFVRDPFDRLVSSYYNKMVMKNWLAVRQDLRWMRDEILTKYRGIDPKKSYDSPTPVEFAKYIIDSSLKIGVENINVHFRPLWASCPFCAINFDIIGKLENYEEDEKFIVQNLNLKIPLGMHRNDGGGNKTSRRTEFFSKIPIELTRGLFKIYELDFDMFGYEKPIL